MQLIRTHELNEAQRRAAEARHAMREVYDPQPQHGTEGCADTSEDEPRRMPEGGLICLLLACAAVASCAALALWGAR